MQIETTDRNQFFIYQIDEILLIFGEALGNWQCPTLHLSM